MAIQAGSVRITLRHIFHGRSALGLFFQARHHYHQSVAQDLNPQFNWRLRRRFPDLLLDLGKSSFKRVSSSIGIIGHDVKGEDVAFEAMREVCIPLLGSQISGRARRMAGRPRRSRPAVLPGLRGGELDRHPSAQRTA